MQNALRVLASKELDRRQLLGVALAGAARLRSPELLPLARMLARSQNGAIRCPRCWS